MARVTFLELYNSLSKALDVRTSLQIEKYEVRGIQLLPNNPIPYIQTTNNPDGVELEDWTAYIVNACTGAETEITDQFYVERVFQDDDGIGQIDFSLTNIPFDFGYDLVYLKVDQGIGETFYSNVFQLTDDVKEETARLDYRNTALDTMQSIQVKMWYWQQLKSTELSTYYETSTKNTVSVLFKEQKHERWITDMLSNDLIIKISDVFSNKFVYLNFVRAYLFEAIEIQEHESGADFYEQEIKLSFNSRDVYDPLATPPPVPELPIITLSDITVSGFEAIYTFSVLNFTPTSLVFQYSSDQVTWISQNGAATSPVNIPFEEFGTWYFRIIHPQAQSNVIVVVLSAVLVANNDEATVARGQMIDINVLFNDVLSGTVEIIAISTPTNGTAQLFGNLIRYAHNNSATVSDSFTYTIDNGSTQDTATVNMLITGEPTSSTAFQTSANGSLEDSELEGIGQRACGLVLNATRYHGGGFALPVVGDFIYTDAALTTAYNGNNLWFTISGGKTIKINTEGRVINAYICGSGGS